MTGDHPAQAGECRVVGAAKLSAPLDRDTICTAIADAMAAQAPRARYKVEVTVQSASRIAANLVVNGKSLPTQNMAVSDGELRAGSIRRFADALAGLAAKV